jgi:aspartate racemase
MKKIGIIGGLAWPSTIDYYRLLCTKTNDYFKSRGHGAPYPSPPIVLESVNMAYTRSLRGNPGDQRSWTDFDEVFRSTLLRLKTAGAEFGVIASNTPHMRIDAIMDGLDFPVISILDTTALESKKLGADRALVLGTSVTMKNRAYRDVLRKHEISAVPQLSDQIIAELDQIIDEDLYVGRIQTARDKITKISKQHIGDPSKDVVCLACTELPLAYPEHQNSASFVDQGITYINTTVAHVDVIFETAIE